MATGCGAARSLEAADAATGAGGPLVDAAGDAVSARCADPSTAAAPCAVAAVFPTRARAATSSACGAST
ncbi:hypothetical protein BURPSPAST_A0990 [Burkholderia pseudomallei Pasteur 52237]|nr:hypothetical protein BURPSPAST_A0990 [Burkholderia pseudomallei Pasteur 52237]